MPKRETHVALLRGINVGGKNKLPMKELADLFRDAGCADVRTYIQSGNVVFSAPARVLRNLDDVIRERIAQRFDLRVPIVLRSASALAAIADANPYAERAEDHPKALHVMFLKDRPREQAVEALDPDRSPPDAYVVRGSEIYLFCPDGVARTKLTTAFFDKALGTVSTVRNWRTVQKLLDMTSGRV